MKVLAALFALLWSVDEGVQFEVDLLPAESVSFTEEFNERRQIHRHCHLNRLPLLGWQSTHELNDPRHVLLEDEIVMKMVRSVLVYEAVIVVGQFRIGLTGFALLRRLPAALFLVFLLVEHHALEYGAWREAERIHAALVEIEDVGPEGAVRLP